MPTAVAVTSDLIFSTKILSTARSLGIEARAVATPQALKTVLDSGDVRMVMVDMSLSGDAAVGAVECAAHDGRRPTVLAFFSHVQGALGEAARRAGATLVMPRSTFSAELPDLLRTYCGSPAGDV